MNIIKGMGIAAWLIVRSQAARIHGNVARAGGRHAFL